MFTETSHQAINRSEVGHTQHSPEYSSSRATRSPALFGHLYCYRPTTSSRAIFRGLLCTIYCRIDPDKVLPYNETVLLCMRSSYQIVPVIRKGVARSDPIFALHRLPLPSSRIMILPNIVVKETLYQSQVILQTPPLMITRSVPTGTSSRRDRLASSARDVPDHGHSRLSHDGHADCPRLIDRDNSDESLGEERVVRVFKGKGEEGTINLHGSQKGQKAQTKS